METVAVYSIKEISNTTGYKPHVIRFYEKEFDLTIPRDENNRRYFTPKEVEQFKYIKNLQQKGLSNKQIKQVLNSPQQENMLIQDTAKEEIAAVSNQIEVKNIEDYREQRDSPKKEELQYLMEEIFSLLSQFDHKKEIYELSLKIDELKAQLQSQEKDVLLCENAKLKMKMKEKSYEIAELKDKLKREQNKKISIFNKIFGTK
ncbi:MAG: MerR family transcriptional regulator [Clostridiaceae bacterium]|nr:MerR family transcriptional regulator [Clostridiaceae bacterium]